MQTFHSNRSLDSISPKQARNMMLHRQARNDRRLLVSCALAGTAILVPGLAGALFDAWPAIVAGFALACIVLALEWSRWRQKEKAVSDKETQALSAWIAAQKDPFSEARKIESGHYGPEIARVASQWLNNQQRSQEAGEPQEHARALSSAVRSSRQRPGWTG